MYWWRQIGIIATLFWSVTCGFQLEEDTTSIPIEKSKRDTIKIAIENCPIGPLTGTVHLSILSNRSEPTIYEAMIELDVMIRSLFIKRRELSYNLSEEALIIQKDLNELLGTGSIEALLIDGIDLDYDEEAKGNEGEVVEDEDEGG